MIVLDEQLNHPRVVTAVRRLSRGAVVVINDLLLAASIDDPAITRLLRKRRGCTFVTINWSDFWRKVHPDRRFSVVCLQITQQQVREVAELLRRLLRHPDFRTQRQRCGKVILVGADNIRYYERLAGEVHEVSWR